MAGRGVKERELGKGYSIVTGQRHRLKDDFTEIYSSGVDQHLGVNQRLGVAPKS